MTKVDKSTEKKTFYKVVWFVAALGLWAFSVRANALDETEKDSSEDKAEKSDEAAAESYEEDNAKMRLNIIDLIEKDLSQAYSYTQSSTHRLPHFEIIDKIYPKWHHGNAAAARQFWLNANYRTFMVLYRVDYVYLINDAAARVEGKRLIVWNENEEGIDIEKYWPFQLWAALGKRTHRDNTYLSAAYAQRYKMKLALNEKGEWVVAEEMIADNPEMVNNIKNPCLFEKQLEDFGLKNDCNKKLLPGMP